SGEKNMLIVSHGDILGLLHAMFFGVSVEDLNDRGMHGAAGSVSHLQVWDNGKHMICRLGDMSYLK
ncbi:MAG: histidine phosphatase family protein, partial [Clostridiales bacterium]|nr:histidine phosphatase family protein [Clostridiales bacterium]